MKFERVIAVAVGALLYSLLNWIPFLGPLVSGFIAGRIDRAGLRDGFVVGCVSAVFGFLLVVGALDVFNIGVDSISDVLVFWVFMLWNLLGSLLAGVGGALGSVLAGPSKPVHGPRRPFGGGADDAVSDAEVYVVCPACGYSNSEEDERCRSCGTRIME